MSSNLFESYQERLKKAKEFYSKYEIKISKKNEILAIQSLTMPVYAKEYNDVNEVKIHDNTSLATLGDAVCGVYLMNKEFNNSISKEELTNKKQALENKELNKLGKKLLSDYLFKRNNDGEGTQKADATNFEAFIGFIYTVKPKKAFEILELYLNN